MKVNHTTRAVATAAVGAAMSFLITSCASPPVQAPSLGIHAVTNPTVVERGRYLVYGPAHCAECHGDPARDPERSQALEVPLTGGRRLSAGPLGAIVVPNITSDPVTGIGALSDDTLVQILRYGVSRHGNRPTLPFMSFADMADDDLQAILSFIRTLPPAPGISPASDLGRFGTFALRHTLGPQGPTSPSPESVPRSRTADYGRYLAYTVANCNGCHTKRSKLTGAFVGKPFAGGMRLKESTGIFYPPNLTPIATGVMHGRTEEQFIRLFRFKAGTPCESPMPWWAFAHMTDDDLGAIFRYLQTLPPTHTPNG